jgi:hypothetical protein
MLPKYWPHIAHVRSFPVTDQYRTNYYKTVGTGSDSYFSPSFIMAPQFER